MKYIVFPNYHSVCLPLEDLLIDGVVIIAGPTPSRCYIIEAEESIMELQKIELNNHYIIMEDFETITIH
jgi:hypothetical protein